MPRTLLLISVDTNGMPGIYSAAKSVDSALANDVLAGCLSPCLSSAPPHPLAGRGGGFGGCGVQRPEPGEQGAEQQEGHDLLVVQ